MTQGYIHISGEEFAGTTAVSRAEVGQAQVGCAGYSLGSSLTIAIHLSKASQSSWSSSLTLLHTILCPQDPKQHAANSQPIYHPTTHARTHLHVRKLPPKGKYEVHEGDRGGHPGAQAHRVPLTHGLRFRPGVPVCTHTRWESGREGGWEAVVQVCTQRAGSRGAGCRGSEVVLKRACEHTSRHVQA